MEEKEKCCKYFIISIFKKLIQKNEWIFALTMKPPQVSQRESPCFHCLESHKMVKLHNCYIPAECLGQAHAGSLIVHSVPISPGELIV